MKSIDDNFVKYIGQYKSPYEEDDVPQEELEYDGYMKFHRDSILNSIGKKDCQNKISLYWDDFIKSCNEQQKIQFVKNCINQIIKKYNMPYLIQVVDMDDPTQEEVKKCIKFIKFLCGSDKWIKYISLSLHKLTPKITQESPKLKIFIDSDYDYFKEKIDSYKSCNELMRNYFRDCSADEGKLALLKIIASDYGGVLIYQFHNLKN